MAVVEALGYPAERDACARRRERRRSVRRLYEHMFVLSTDPNLKGNVAELKIAAERQGSAFPS